MEHLGVGTTQALLYDSSVRFHDVLVQLSLTDGGVLAERAVHERLRVREQVLLQLLLFVEALVTQGADEWTLVYGPMLNQVRPVDRTILLLHINALIANLLHRKLATGTFKDCV